MALIVGNEIISTVVAFVGTNFKDENWKRRYASLIALGAITEGPDKLQFMNTITPGLPDLVKMFHDPHAKVREAIAWVISKICENHSDVIANPVTMQNLMPIFMDALKDKPRISNQICRALENLA
jgi:hypothetical protein